MPTNDYQPIANGGGANVETQAQYLIDLASGGSLQTGYIAGLAKSAQVNKTLRQSSVMTAALAQFIVNTLNTDVLDDGDVTALTALIKQAIQYPLLTQPLTDATSISWDVTGGRVARVTLGGNRLLNFPTGLQAGMFGWLDVIQDGTGNRTLALAAGYKNPFGIPPSLSTTPLARDRFYWSTWDGTTVDLTLAKGMA